MLQLLMLLIIVGKMEFCNHSDDFESIDYNQLLEFKKS